MHSALLKIAAALVAAVLLAPLVTKIIANTAAIMVHADSTERTNSSW